MFQDFVQAVNTIFKKARNDRSTNVNFFSGENFFYFKIGVSSIGLELLLQTESDDLARFRILTNKTMLNSDSRHQSCFQIIENP